MNESILFARKRRDCFIFLASFFPHLFSLVPTGLLFSAFGAYLQFNICITVTLRRTCSPLCRTRPPWVAKFGRLWSAMLRGKIQFSSLSLNLCLPHTDTAALTSLLNERHLSTEEAPGLTLQNGGAAFSPLGWVAHAGSESFLIVTTFFASHVRLVMSEFISGVRSWHHF